MNVLWNEVNIMMIETSPMKLFYGFMIIFALFLIPIPIFAQNSDSSDILLSEISVDEYKSFIENQLINLADSIRVNPIYQTISSLLFIVIGALLGFLGSFLLIEYQNLRFRNKIKSLISMDFNSLSSDLVSCVKPLQDAKNILMKKLQNIKHAIYLPM